LLDEGFKVGENRIHRIMKANRIRAKIGKKQRKMKYGAPSKVSDNVLKQQFNAGKPNEIWVGDTTYIRTLQGWLYLATVIDLFSRKVVGWAMSARNNSKLTVDSIQMAVKHRKIEGDLVFHSDQGVQYSSIPFLSALKSNNIISSMSRRGNCYDNAVAESSFQLLKREKIQGKVYKTRDEAKSDIFEYIELFYNSKRRHNQCDLRSPNEYEKQYFLCL
jgi:putative transposase